MNTTRPAPVCTYSLPFRTSSLKNIIKEAKESEGKTILFIDEMHMLLAAGAGSGGMTAGR